jgi:serine/threonine-protein kinase
MKPELREQLQSALADRYALERELGRGGMATVYLARDLKHDRPVALKVLHPELAASLGPDRFLREVKLAARLQHPHIMSVLDSGESAGRLWFTMPYIEGESLRDRMTREKQLPVADAIRLTREAALALDFAHRRGVVHRDIKPENILLVDGQALVSDFGIARALQAGEEKLTETGLVVGTPAYMSPEQSAGDRELDGRSDIYSLGTVLYEMLAGEPPFTGPTAQAIMIRRLSDPAPPVRRARPAVPEAVERALLRALAPTAADRFPTAAEFARAIEAGERSTETATVTRPAAPAPVSPRAHPRRVPLTAVLAVGFLLGAGLLFGWLRRHGPGDEGSGAGGARVIAVLPFENLGEASDEYFADGITDEVRGKLATISGLQVIASSSAGQYKHSAKTPQQIAGELGVGYLLVGKIRWEKSASGTSRVRVSPELIQVPSAGAPTTKWQQPFDASLTDVFQVQADIAGRVAEALNVALGADAREQLAERPTANLAAYDAYLQGVEAFGKGARPVTLRLAVVQFEQAVALDTSFAPAWARLSQAASLLNGQTVPDSARAARSRIAAERAVALAPDRPEGHVAMGDYYRRVELDHTRALDAYTAAQRVTPADADMLRGTALAEQGLGRWDPSLEHLRRAQTLDPRSLPIASVVATTYLWLRRAPEAIAAADRALALSPESQQNFETKVMALLGQGDTAGAHAAIAARLKTAEPTAVLAYLATYYDLFWALDDAQQRIVVRLGPSQFDDDRGAWGLALAGTYAVRGDQARARAYADSARIAMEEQLKGVPDDAALHAYLATALAHLGRKAEAIREGERSVALLPLSRDRLNGLYLQHQLAVAYIMLGEPERALDHLEPLLKVPYYLTPAWLQIDPAFRPLRSNPRFRRLVEGTT